MQTSKTLQLILLFISMNFFTQTGPVQMKRNSKEAGKIGLWRYLLWIGTQDYSIAVSQNAALIIQSPLQNKAVHGFQHESLPVI